MANEELLNKLANTVIELDEADEALEDAKIAVCRARGAARLAKDEIRGKAQLAKYEIRGGVWGYTEQDAGGGARIRR